MPSDAVHELFVLFNAMRLELHGLIQSEAQAARERAALAREIGEIRSELKFRDASPPTKAPDTSHSRSWDFDLSEIRKLVMALAALLAGLSISFQVIVNRVPLKELLDLAAGSSH